MSAVSAGRRIAAIGALAGVALLGVFVVTILVRHAGDLVLALAGFAIAVAAGWWFVTRHMPTRAVGAAGAIVGLALSAIAIVHAFRYADRVLWRLAVIVGLFVFTVVCARLAMRHDLHRIEITAWPAGPPRHAVLLCNPRSGGGKVEKFGLVELARDLGVETVMLEPGLDLEQLARDAVARGADCLGMAGGDGSQALVASIAIEHDLPFVCVSAGTRNHFALDLGLNRDDPRESMHAFRDAIERRVDYATVNGRLFVNNVSLGVYAEIVQQDEYRDAKVETTRELLPELLAKGKPFDLQFTTPEGDEVDGAIVVMVSNNPYVLGLSPDNAQRRRLDTGRLGVFAVTTSTGAEAASLLTAAALGQRNRSPYWHEFTVPTFEVRSRGGKAYAGVDGEALDLPTPLKFEIHPLGLTLLVPAGNIAAAERKYAREFGPGDLLAVAAGHTPKHAL